MCRTVLTSRTGRGPEWSARRNGMRERDGQQLRQSPALAVVRRSPRGASARDRHVRDRQVDGPDPAGRARSPDRRRRRRRLVAGVPDRGRPEPGAALARGPDGRPARRQAQRLAVYCGPQGTRAGSTTASTPWYSSACPSRSSWSGLRRATPATSERIRPSARGSCKTSQKWSHGYGRRQPQNWIRADRLAKSSTRSRSSRCASADVPGQWQAGDQGSGGPPPAVRKGNPLPPFSRTQRESGRRST
jgi:hypothetical protein